MYVTLPNLLCFESVFTHLTWNCLVIHNWVEQKTETQNPSYSEFLAVFYSTRLDFNVFPISTTQKIHKSKLFSLSVSWSHPCMYSENNFWTILLTRSNQLQNSITNLELSQIFLFRLYWGRKQKSMKSQNL